MFFQSGPAWDLLQVVTLVHYTLQAPLFALVNLAAGLLGKYLIFTVDPFWWGAVLLFTTVLVGAALGFTLQFGVNRLRSRSEKQP